MSLPAIGLFFFISSIKVYRVETFRLSNSVGFPFKFQKLSMCASAADTSSTIDLKKNSVNQMKLGILLLNLGGPSTQKDVEGFLYNLFADPDIIRLPSLLSIFQKPLAYFIAKRRAPQSSLAYKSIGGGSPIVKYANPYARKLEQNHYFPKIYISGIPKLKLT